MPVYRSIAARATVKFTKSPFIQTTLASLPWPGFKTQDRQIPTEESTSISIRIYHPAPGSSDILPVVLNLHGGGWCLGGLDTDAFICQLMCRSTKIIVVDVDYRLAPEVTYPSIVSDVYSAVKWVCTPHWFPQLPLTWYRLP
jgi:acetyl esterase/lipase